MSRFFRGDSSSESDSDEEELYTDDEVEEKVASDDEESSEEEDDEGEESDSSEEGGSKKTGINQFLRDAGSDSEDSSSDDERTKVVKSAKDKRYEELEGTIKAIENGQKINDWGSISAGVYPGCIFASDSN